MATLESRLGSLITAIGADVKSLLSRTTATEADISTLEGQLGSAHGVLVLNTGAPVPGGTPSGTVIFRRS